MPVSEICNREVIIVQPGNTAHEAAQLMRSHHVGDVVIVDDSGGVRKPVGIVTDRDLAIEVLSARLDPALVTVNDIVTTELFTIREDAGLFDAIELMRKAGVRRLPVVAGDGALVGILALDDLLELLAEELLSLSKLVRHERKIEAERRR